MSAPGFASSASKSAIVASSSSAKWIVAVRGSVATTRRSRASRPGPSKGRRLGDDASDGELDMEPVLAGADAQAAARASDTCGRLVGVVQVDARVLRQQLEEPGPRAVRVSRDVEPCRLEHDAHLENLALERREAADADRVRGRDLSPDGEPAPFFGRWRTTCGASSVARAAAAAGMRKATRSSASSLAAGSAWPLRARGGSRRARARAAASLSSRGSRRRGLPRDRTGRRSRTPGSRA